MTCNTRDKLFAFDCNRLRARGFTLLEVVVALAILALSLVVLLQSQASALDAAGRSRDMTVATLLVRSKIIDIEQRLFHDGFSLDTQEDDGDFTEEEHPEIKWKSRISEITLDIGALTSICGMLPTPPGEKKSDDHTAQNDCETQVTTLGQSLAPFTDELARSMRAVELMVTWPVGRYTQSMSVRSLITRDDFSTEQETNAAKAQNQFGGAGVAPTPATGAATAGPSIRP